MNWRAVRAIALKDVRATGANLQVMLPMLVVPLVLGILMPGGLVWALLRFGESSGELDELLRLLERVPVGGLGDALTTFPDPSAQAVFLFANYLLAPFFLLIPLMASSTISADSFAGEKERGTLESLLYSPVTTGELFLGKVLAAFLPAVGLAWGTFLLTAVTVNAVAWPWLGRVFFPTPNWLPLMLLVIPLLSLATVFLNVFVSARVGTFQAAYQLGGVLVLPVLALVVGNIAGLLLFSSAVIALVGSGLAVADALMLLALRRFMDRARLFESQVG